MSPINPHLSAPNRKGIIARIRKLMEFLFKQRKLKPVRRNYEKMLRLFDQQYGTQEMEDNSRWHLCWWQHGGPTRIDEMVRSIAHQCLDEEMAKPKRGSQAKPAKPADISIQTQEGGSDDGDEGDEGGGDDDGGSPPAADVERDPDDEYEDETVTPDADASDNLEPEG